MESMVLVVKRHVSAEDIRAARSAAITNPFNPGGKRWLIMVGKAASGLMWGNNTRADMPISVIIKAHGINARATVMAAPLAVFLFRAQKSLENISGPTKYVEPTRKKYVASDFQEKCALTGKEKYSAPRVSLIDPMPALLRQRGREMRIATIMIRLWIESVRITECCPPSKV